MRISQLAKATGVSIHRLRRYESAELIFSTRGSNGYRNYADTTVREVIFIAMGREIGFSLPQIASYLPQFRIGTLTSAEMIAALQSRIVEVDAAIAAQQALRSKLVDHIQWFKKRKHTK